METLQASGVGVQARSRWYRSAPVPPSDQPWFVNAVASLETGLSPAELLAKLHEIEAAFGRTRLGRNEARVLDLDLLAYHGRVSAPGESPVLPHPRLAERAFVVLPLAELAPGWQHPVSGLSASQLASLGRGDLEILADLQELNADLDRTDPENGAVTRPQSVMSAR